MDTLCEFNTESHSLRQKTVPTSEPERSQVVWDLLPGRATSGPIHLPRVRHCDPSAKPLRLPSPRGALGGRSTTEVSARRVHNPHPRLLNLSSWRRHAAHWDSRETGKRDDHPKAA